jgi:uncharacterized protein YndB with AHSA1/START domain
MNSQPVVIEQVLDAPVERVWDALTKNEQMKQWYFHLPDFKAVPGFEFIFVAGAEDDVQYKHICRVVEVVPQKKLSYSWRYDGYPGQSMVSFELVEEGDQTWLKLTHAGLETFSSSGPDFARESFAAGCTQIIGNSLKGFLKQNQREPESLRRGVRLEASCFLLHAFCFLPRASSFLKLKYRVLSRFSHNIITENAEAFNLQFNGITGLQPLFGIFRIVKFARAI